ncbi:MAG: metalloregulator ArsR/SmtB family transcription factor [Micrococcales bacterium]|nr:metalloregulator ArsR/SmtB family transcription factor [Micrococcales bacterium]
MNECPPAGDGRTRLDDDLASLTAEVFRLLADGTRIRLLWALTGGELTVSNLAGVVGKPQPSVSQHLAKLRMARLVRARRDGARIYYSLENAHVERLVTDAVQNAEHAMPGVPSHHVDDAAAPAVEGDNPS